MRYIYKLRDLHLACENLTEAGFTLLLHAELLDWDSHVLPIDLGYPAQPEWQRKEQLYLKIIDYFDRGKVRYLIRMNRNISNRECLCDPWRLTYWAFCN